LRGWHPIPVKKKGPGPKNTLNQSEYNQKTKEQIIPYNIIINVEI